MKKIFSAIILATILTLTHVSMVSANHSWGDYHWARTTNPFTLKLGDNLTASWKPYLSVTSTDWSISTVLDTTIVTGQARANCKATAGRIEVCNKNYGNNGWLGIAQIWVNGSHITQATTKLNDTYFTTAKYNTPAWKQLVMCQEVGHNFGLDHQDENFNNANLNTCMDYTNDPSTNMHPNAHDYEELGLIYTHVDAFTTISQALSQVNQGQGDNPGDDIDNWGKLVRKSAGVAVYERDLGDGRKLLTDVFYAE